MKIPIFGRFLPSTGSLSARAVQAGSWSALLIVSSHTLRLLGNLIMTRLLVPEAFGLMAMVTTVAVALTLLSDIGIEKSIIREIDGDDPHFLRVAWVVKILRSMLVAGGVCGVAISLGFLGPTYAASGTIYADPRLGWLLAISALMPLLNGSEATTKELAQRRLQMSRFTVIEIGTQIIAIVAMFTFAQISATVWALMAGTLLGSIVKFAASHIIYLGPRMRFDWDWQIVARLWKYGKWLMGSSVFTFLALNADRIILGGLLTSTSFGTYAIARVWIDAGRQLVGQIVGRVGFTSIGEVLRDRPQDAPRVFRRFQRVVDLLCLLAFIMAFAFGQLFIDVMYSNAYSAAGDYVEILSISILVARFDSFQGFLMNVGDSRSAMEASAMRAASICASVPLAYDEFGIVGALYAVVLSPLASVPYVLWRLRSLLGVQIRIDALWAMAIVGFLIGYAKL